MLAVAGCGGSDAPAVCGSLETLSSDIDGLQEIDIEPGEGSVAEIEESLDTIRTEARVARSFSSAAIVDFTRVKARPEGLNMWVIDDPCPKRGSPVSAVGEHSDCASTPKLDNPRTRVQRPLSKGGIMWWAIGFGGLLYIILGVTLGVMTLRNGHGWMFFFGIFFPLLWIFGAFMQPTERAAV